MWDAHKHLSRGMESGEVQPLPWTVYSRDHAQEAFRFLAGGPHSHIFCPIPMHAMPLVSFKPLDWASRQDAPLHMLPLSHQEAC